MRGLLVVGLGAGLLGGCAAKRISVQVLEPAEREVPSEIRRIGVVDRSAAAGVGETVIGLIEALATGEPRQSDTDGRAAAVQAAVEALRGSPRYDEVVLLTVDRRRSGSSLYDKPLDWPRAASLAQEAGVDALLALEAFDSDGDVTAAPHDGGWAATRRTDVLASWRLYDPGARQVVDVLRETRTADTRTELGPQRAAAVAALPDARNTVITVARLAGEAYARRIGPDAVEAERRYYASGDDRLRAARAAVLAGDWEAAREQWASAATSPHARVAGRATYNLALREEVCGNLSDAIALARQAAVALDQRAARAYVEALERRRDAGPPPR